MNRILLEFKNLDKSILRVVKNGLVFCLIFCLFATLILEIYKSVHIPNLFNIGISLLQTGSFFAVSFIAYGFIFNKVKN